MSAWLTVPPVMAAPEVKTTCWPSPEIMGSRPPQSVLGVPGHVLTALMEFETMSLTKTSTWLLLSPGTMLVARPENAIYRPSADTPPSELPLRTKMP